MAPSSRFRATPHEGTLPGVDPAGIRILVVDDQEIVRLQLKRILKRAGFAVLEAADGAATLDLLASEPVDLILSDIRMPGMTGVDLVKAIAPRIPDTAVVMVSGQPCNS